MSKTLAYSLSDVLSNDHGVSNLLWVYAQATHAELQAGMNWYANAYADAVYIAKTYGLDVELVIKVAAVLSPQMDWDNNMPAAELVIRYWLAGGYITPVDWWSRFGGDLPLMAGKDHDCGVASDACFDHPATAYRANQLKALWLLQGHDESLIIQGPKVQAFVDNITHHETSRNVTVDSHAIQAWFGYMTPGTYSIPDKAYPLIQADYCKAAALVGITPLQFQAVVWLAKKRLQDSKDLNN